MKAVIVNSNDEHIFEQKVAYITWRAHFVNHVYFIF